MNKSIRTIVTVGVSLLLAMMGYLTVRSVLHARQVQELMIDRSEIKHVKYGLLNLDEWGGKVSVILEKKINEFEITPDNSQAILKNIENILYMLIDEVEKMMLERTSGQFSQIKRWIAGLTFDMDQLRDSVPSYSLQILQELEKPENQKVIKDFLEEKLEAYTDSTGFDQSSSLQPLLEKYDCKTKEACEQLIIDQISHLSDFQVQLVVLIILLGAVILMGGLYILEQPGAVLSILMVICLCMLLVGGIASPMIALEATIDRVHFNLLGDEVIFGENIIYFRSKSITDVVWMLIQDGSIPMIIVGVLIFSFSIIFPTLKLISSLGYQLGNDRIKSNTWIRWFVFHSGKWSMADVIVVAIFMAYIGMNSIVRTQMDNLSMGPGPVEINTSNGTQLLSGFYLFLSYCLFGLLFSEKLLHRPAIQSSS